MLGPYLVGHLFDRDMYWMLPVLLSVGFTISTVLALILYQMNRVDSGRLGAMACITMITIAVALALSSTGALANMPAESAIVPDALSPFGRA